MTEILIDGYPVILPKDFSTTIKTENPILTKNGEYSYDITLNLNNGINAVVFGHLNRVNTKLPKKEWSAVMIVNNQVLLNGKAILVSNTVDTISLQLISGNSELNYLIGSDKLISMLDLGKIETLTAKEANESLKKHWPESNYVIAPIYNGGIINSYEVEFNQAEWPISNIVVQPYLGYYLEAIPKALGYTIKENVLRGNIFLSMLYILNISSSREYKDFIPGKKAVEFLTEAEKFLNIVFVVDKNDKSIRILEYSGIQDKFGLISLDSLDDYNVETSEDGSDINVNYQVCEYDLPDSTYYKFQNIDTIIINNCEKKTYSDFNAMYSALKADMAGYYNKNVLFNCESSESKYLVDKDADNQYYLRRVHLFGKTGHTREDEDPTTSFKIVPAEIVVQKIWYRLGGDAFFGYMQYPKSSLSRDDSNLSEQGLLDKIKTGLAHDPSGANYIECALYYGRYFILNKDGSSVINIKRYPLSITDYLLDIVKIKEVEVDNNAYGRKEYTFRLNSTNGRYSAIYSQNAIIDHKKKYTFSFITNKVLDPRSIFIIHNRGFICQEIEYSITLDGMNRIAKGIFYPYEISNSEISKEWILGKGIWNDKGIWDDFKPWNDN